MGSFYRQLFILILKFWQEFEEGKVGATVDEVGDWEVAHGIRDLKYTSP